MTRRNGRRGRQRARSEAVEDEWWLVRGANAARSGAFAKIMKHEGPLRISEMRSVGIERRVKEARSNVRRGVDRRLAARARGRSSVLS